MISTENSGCNEGFVPSVKSRSVVPLVAESDAPAVADEPNSLAKAALFCA